MDLDIRIEQALSSRKSADQDAESYYLEPVGSRSTNGRRDVRLGGLKDKAKTTAFKLHKQSGEDVEKG